MATSPLTISCNCPSPWSSSPSMADLCGGSSLFAFMTLLQTYIFQSCHISDPCNSGPKVEERLPMNIFDFVVVGGGTAGAVVASRLSENQNWTVLLVEAGGDEPIAAQVPSMFSLLSGDKINWKYKTQPQKNVCLSSSGKCSWSRGKMLGGSSAVNDMIYMRGDPKDYDSWKANGNPHWGYDDVLPLFEKFESQLNPRDAPLHSEQVLLPLSQFPHAPDILHDFERAIAELDETDNRTSISVSIANTMSKNGVRYSTSRAYLKPLHDRDNLYVLLNAVVTRLLIDENTKNTAGIEFVQDGEMQRVIVKKEVILSAGPINSPKILLLSGIGPKDELEKVGVPVIQDLPGVGKNLQDHLSVFLNFHTKHPNTNLLNVEAALDYLLKYTGPMSGTGLSSLIVKYVSKYAENSDVADTQLQFGGYLANCAKTGSEEGSNGNRSVQIFPTLLRPKSRGYITLKSSDPLAEPLIFANYLANITDLKILTKAVKFAYELSTHKIVKESHELQFDYSTNECDKKYKRGSLKYWICVVRHNTVSQNHQAGTCKMGPATDLEAVVDHRLRVHNIKHLRVIDSSIMPNIISGNPNGPTILIAEKGASMIQQSWIWRRKHNKNKKRTQ